MHLTRHLTYANVVSTLCLFVLAIGVAGGGVAYAHHAKIGTSDIKNGAVKTPKIATNAVTSPKIKNRTIKAKDFSPRAAGVALAGVRVTSNGVVVHSFNRLGGTPTVSKPTNDTYNIVIPGAQFDSWSNTMGVTTGGYDRDCFQNSDPGESTIQIRCTDLAGAFQSAYFTYILYADASSAGFSPRTAPREAAVAGR